MKKIKWGWGQFIWIVYGLFALGILGLVYASTQQKLELIDEQYYQQELNYQGRLNAKNRANQRGQLVFLEEGELHIISDVPVQVQVHAYCPSNSSYDRKWSLPSVQANRWELPLEELPNAQYRLDVEWVEKGDTLFQSLWYRQH
jgi:heme exporter protein D